LACHHWDDLITGGSLHLHQEVYQNESIVLLLGFISQEDVCTAV